MIDTNALKGRIAEKGMSQANVAKAIGITPKTFYTKMDKGIFRSDEIEAMIDILKGEPTAIFYESSMIGIDKSMPKERKTKWRTNREYANYYFPHCRRRGICMTLKPSHTMRSERW